MLQLNRENSLGLAVVRGRFHKEMILYCKSIVVAK